MARPVVSLCLAALLVAPAAAAAQTAKGEPFVTVQPEGQWLASLFIGQPVTNGVGERIGDINDLLFDRNGRVVNAVIGVGGFLGIGEKSVAVPYGSLSIAAGADGKRMVTLPMSKEQLNAAPAFKPTEKTVYMRARDGSAGEIKKPEEMRR